MCVCTRVYGHVEASVCQVSSSIALSIIIVVVVIWGCVYRMYVSVCAKVKTRRQHQVPLPLLSALVFIEPVSQ